MSLRNRYARFFRSANARLGSKPRPRYKPLLEGLENRALLSTTSTWTGNGDGTSFNQATNWSPVGVPGPSNDAVINVGSGVTINLPTSGISVNSLMQTNGTLVMPFGSGTFTTTTGLTLKTGILNDNSGSISGGATLINSTLNLTSSSGSAQFVTEGSSTLNGPISSNQPVQVEGVTTDIGRARQRCAHPGKHGYRQRWVDPPSVRMAPIVTTPTATWPSPAERPSPTPAPSRSTRPPALATSPATSSTPGRSTSEIRLRSRSTGTHPTIPSPNPRARSSALAVYTSRPVRSTSTAARP